MDLIPEIADPSILSKAASNRGETLKDLSAAAPLLVVFLRHLGCAFCRETLSDLARFRSELQRQGVGIALIHMADDRDAKRLFLKYRMDDVPRFSDVDRELYAAFGLARGSFRQLLGWENWKRFASAGRNHGVGSLIGDALQMPGIFVIDQGNVVAGYLHDRVSSRPNYTDLVSNVAGGTVSAAGLRQAVAVA